MAILYEDKPSRWWFWGAAIFLLIMLVLQLPDILSIFAPPPSVQDTGNLPGLSQTIQQSAAVEKMSGIIFIVVALTLLVTFYTITSGTSLVVTDEGIEWTKFFQKSVILFNNIALVDSADISSEVYLGKRHGPPLVKTAGGEEFRPDEYYTDPFKQGVAFFLKNGKKIFIMVKDRESLISLLKSKMC